MLLISIFTSEELGREIILRLDVDILLGVARHGRQVSSSVSSVIFQLSAMIVVISNFNIMSICPF